MTKISLRMDAPGDGPALRSLSVLRELAFQGGGESAAREKQGKVKPSRRRTGVPQK
jgi:hypothetical protein